MDNNIEGKQEGKKYDGLRVEVSLPEDASGLAATPNTLTGGTGGSQSHLSATKQNRLASEDNYTPSPGASARFDFMQVCRIQFALFKNSCPFFAVCACVLLNFVLFDLYVCLLFLFVVVVFFFFSH